MSTRPRRLPRFIAGVAIIVGLVGAANWWWVMSPVSAKLRDDPRNAGIVLRAHYGYGVLPSVLVLDLRAVPNGITPAEIGRVLFMAADTLSVREAPFSRVILARHGEALYALRGEDFLTLGRSVRAGENPVYLVRTLPQQLQEAETGRAAFSTWEGGILFVARQQIEDFNRFAGRWAGAIE